MSEQWNVLANILLFLHHLLFCSLGDNNLDDETKAAIKFSWGDRKLDQEADNLKL